MVKKSRIICIEINIYHHSFRYNMWKVFLEILLHLVYKVYISLSRVWQPIDSLFVVRDNTNNTWKFVELIDKIIPASERDYLWQHGISYTWITWRCTGTLHDRVTEWARVASRNSTTESGRTWTGPWSSGGSTPGTRNVGTGQGLWEGKYCFFFILVFKIPFCLLNVYCSGFFNCLSKDGKVYDEIKHVWLQARQVRDCYHQ